MAVEEPVAISDFATEFYSYLRAENERPDDEPITRNLSNHASELGGPCLRQLVYRRIGSETMPFDDGILGVFWLGNVLEEAVISMLPKLGYRILGRQVREHWEVGNISGAVDAVISKGGESWLTEIKSCDSNVLKKVNEPKDWLKQRDPYCRWYGQLQLYGLLPRHTRRVRQIIIGKKPFMVKDMVCDLDIDYASGLVEKAESVEEYVAAGIIPERIPYCEVCERCPSHITCLPDIDLPASEIVEDYGLGDMLDELENLKEFREEYDDLAEAIKLREQGHGTFDLLLAGKWQVKPKVINVKASVPKPKDAYCYTRFYATKREG